jgi:hypothetical protein
MSSRGVRIVCPRPNIHTAISVTVIQQSSYCSHIKCTDATCNSTGLPVCPAVLTVTNHIKLPQPDGLCSACQVHFTGTPIPTTILAAWHGFQLATTQNNQISPSRPRKYESTSLSNAPQYSKGSQASPACPSDNSSIQMSIKHRWNDTDRRKQQFGVWKSS